MSTVAPRPPLPPRPPLAPALLDSEHFIDEQLRRTRRALKLVDFSAGLITLLAALLMFLLGAAVVDHWVVPGGLGALGRGVCFGLLALVVGLIAWRQFVPLLRPINPVYAAHAIEQGAPSLKNSLLNLLLFRTRRREMSARVYHALEQQAAQRLSTAPVDGAVDHAVLLRLGYALMLVVALCAAYAALSPKNPLTSAARVLAPWSDVAPPSRVRILDVQPGDVNLAKGERLTVSAEIHGVRASEQVRLRYSTNDQTLVDESIAMARPADGVRFAAQLPRASDAAAAGGVQQDLAYWIEAGDARTRRFKLHVYNRPTMVVDRVRYEFPAYTGMPTAEAGGSGDVRGIEGARVTLYGIASQPIKSAYVDFDADGKNDLAMTVDRVQDDRATASFELKLRPDRRTPTHPSYVLRLVTASGRKNVEPAQYRIDVMPDYAPEVRITAPEEPELSVRADQIVPIGVEARDPDFAVTDVRLVGKAGNREILLGELLSKNHAGRFTGMKPVVPADSQLKPGDVLEYWAEARDNRRPEANAAFSEHRRLRIIGADPQPGDKRNQQQQGGQPQSADGQQSGEGNPQAGGQQGEKSGNQSGQGEKQTGESGEQGAGGTSGGQGEQSDNNQDGESQSTPGGAGGQSKDEPSSGDNASGDQQQSGQPNANNSNSGESASAGGQPGDQQQPKPNDAQNDGQPSPGAQGGDSAGAKQSKVSPEGDDDGEAFDRMSQHFAEQEPKNGGGQQAGGQSDQQPAGDNNSAPSDQKAATGGREANQPLDQQPGAQQRQGEPASANGSRGKNSPQQPGEQQANGEQQNGAQPGANQQSDDANQSENANSGQSADERRAPGEQMPDKSAGQPQPGEQNDASHPSGMNKNQGDAGAGRPNDPQDGAPHMDEEQDAQKQARDKTPREQQQSPAGNESPAGSSDKQESDSQGAQSGDRSGGGQTGKGQHADAQGKGDAGQHETADQGAGQSNEQGEGETGNQPGDQQTADGQTGQSSGNQPGAGSKSAAAGQKAATGGRGADQQSGQQPGGKPTDPTQQPPPGDDASADEQPGDDATEQPGDQSNEKSGQQPGDQSDPNANQQSPQQPSGKPASSNQQQPSGDPASEGGQPGESASQQSSAPGDQSASPKPGPQSPDNSAGQQPGGAPGQQPQGGGVRSGEFNGASQPDAPDKEDAANLEFARQQTDLVLERLDQQLGKKKVDPKLLDSLGWNEAELRRFVDRWRGLKSRAESDGDARQELDAALRSLGHIGGPQKFRAKAEQDKLRDLNEGYRSRAPLEYADRVRAYVKGAASTDGE